MDAMPALPFLPHDLIALGDCASKLSGWPTIALIDPVVPLLPYTPAIVSMMARLKDTY
jgi:hypothetical protein